jgi:hypothetical protein
MQSGRGAHLYAPTHVIHTIENCYEWREGAFRNYERLRNAKTDAERVQVAAEIEAFSAGTAQALQQAFSYPSGTDSSERDAYCRAQQKGKLY